MACLTAADHQIVNQELTTLMGGTNARLTTLWGPPVRWGLQGAGKTTNGRQAAKLRRSFGKRPLLWPATCTVQGDQPLQAGQAAGHPLSRWAARSTCDHQSCEAVKTMPLTALRRRRPSAYRRGAGRAEGQYTPSNEILLVVDFGQRRQAFDTRWASTAYCHCWTATPAAVLPCSSGAVTESPPACGYREKLT